jgi:hypothetical protein
MIRVIGFLIALLVSSVATAQVINIPTSTTGVATFTVGIIENDPRITETCIYRIVDVQEKVACATPDSYIDPPPTVVAWKIAEIPVTLPTVPVGVGNEVSYIAYNIITVPDGRGVITLPDYNLVASTRTDQIGEITPEPVLPTIVEVNVAQ